MEQPEQAEVAENANDILRSFKFLPATFPRGNAGEENEMFGKTIHSYSHPLFLWGGSLGQQLQDYSKYIMVFSNFGQSCKWASF